MGKIARVRAVVLPLICIASLAACDTPRGFEHNPQVGHDIGEHRFGEAFTTPEGGKMEMVEEKIIVSFLALIEDSRCPRKVTCVWQGVAKIKAGAIIHPDPARGFEEFTLATWPDSARSVTFEGFRIELVDLSPYPETATTAEPVNHVATLRVTRHE